MRLYAIAGTLLALSTLLPQVPAQPGASLSERITGRPLFGAAPSAAEGGAMGSDDAAPAKTPAAKPRPVADLVSILDTTESKDTFLITVMALRKMGPGAKEALPAIIRNAERLGMVKGIAKAISRKAKGEADTKVSAATEEVCEAILDIASGGRQPAGVLRPAIPPEIYEPVRPLTPAVPQSEPAQPPRATDPAPPVPSGASLGSLVPTHPF